MLQRFFKLAEKGTTPGREVQAGCTTFAAMAYILAVNPAILAAAGMPVSGLITVTAVSAAVSTLIMALYTNFPLALAPGMGINAYFAYTVCLGLGVPWPQALGLVFVNGVAFLALSLTGRTLAADDVPKLLRRLRDEPAFAGRKFGTLAIERTKEPAAALQFHVATRGPLDVAAGGDR